MLKKLAKYGNSTTLVIDKAILELLNMDESSIVKLQTDGKSLIITPVKANNATDNVSYENSEAMNVAKEAAIKKLPNIEFNKEAFLVVQKECLDIFTRYGDVSRKFFTEVALSDNFQNAVAQITQKFDPATHPEEYLKEYNKLKLQFCPELAQMDKELSEIQRKHSQV